MKLRVEYGSYQLFRKCQRCDGLMLRGHRSCPYCGFGLCLGSEVARWVSFTKVSWFNRWPWQHSKNTMMTSQQDVMITVDGKTEIAEEGKLYKGKVVSYEIVTRARGA
jgi:hypothetical protein